MSFYDDMAEVARQMLGPDAQGGFGQGVVVMYRRTPGTPDPAQPWVPMTDEVVSETLLAAVAGTIKFADGVTILATDQKIIAAVPVTVDWRMGDNAILTITIDGRPPMKVIQTKGLPNAGTPAAIEIVVRG